MMADDPMVSRLRRASIFQRFATPTLVFALTPVLAFGCVCTHAHHSKTAIVLCATSSVPPEHAHSLGGTLGALAGLAADLHYDGQYAPFPTILGAEAGYVVGEMVDVCLHER